MRPHHDLRGKHVDPNASRRGDPGCRNSIELSDGDQIDVVLPLVRRDESKRRGSGPAAVHDEPIGNHVEQQLFHF
jgi:hypothetical protein